MPTHRIAFRLRLTLASESRIVPSGFSGSISRASASAEHSLVAFLVRVRIRGIVYDDALSAATAQTARLAALLTLTMALRASLLFRYFVCHDVPPHPVVFAY